MSARSILKRMQDNPHLIEEEYVELFQGSNPSILNHLFQLSIIEDNNRIANFFATSSKIEWLFTRAIENKDENTIDWLLSHGIGIGPWRPNGPTAIHQAIYHNYTAIVDVLFAEIDCSVNYVDLDTGLQHFHAACVSGNLNVTRFLLSNGLVDPRLFFCNKLSNNRSITALHLAVEYSRFEIVKLLLDNGVDLNAKCDEFGWTALHLACLTVTQDQRDCESQLKIMEILLERGCDVNDQDFHGNTSLLSIFQDGCSTNSTSVGNDDDDRQLWKRKIEMLLKYKANVGICNDNGETALHLLIRTMEKLRKPKALAKISFGDEIHVDIAKLLLTAGAPVNFRNQMGQSPLQLAVCLLSLDMLVLLLEFDASSIGIEFDEGGFCYSEDVIPSLEATDNLLKIVERFASNGMILNESSQLAVLKFLIRNHENCRYDDLTDKNASYKLTNLLELGTDESIIAAFSRFPLDMYDTSFIGQSMKKKMVQQLYEHLIILVKGGFYVSNQLRESLQAKIVDLEKCILKIVGSTRKLSDIEYQELENEIQAMKATALNTNTSLYDVLTINPSKIYYYYYIKNFACTKTFLQSEESKLNYSRSKGIIKGHFAKSLVRKYVTESATQYFRYLIDLPLPDLCCEKIFDYLDNDNILNLCVATVDIDFQKRKKFKSNPTV